MKLFLPIAAVLVAGLTRLPAETNTSVTTKTESQNGDYSVLKICQSDYTFKTEDGADAGHMEYVMVDPSEGRIVSAVLTGGVLAERFVAVPYESIHLGPSREITLVHVDRTHLVDAPAIEKERIVHTTHFASDVIRRSYEHFGARVSDLHVDRTRNTESHATQNNEERLRGSRDPNLSVGAADRSSRDRNANERNANDRDHNGTRAQRDRRNEQDPNAVNRSRPDEENRSANNQRKGADENATHDGSKRNRENADARSNNNAATKEGSAKQKVDGPRDEAAPKPGDRAQDAPPSASTMKKDQAADTPPAKHAAENDADKSSSQGPKAQKKGSAEEEHKSSAESAKSSEKAEASKAHESSKGSDEKNEAKTSKSSQEHHANAEGSESHGKAGASRGEGGSSATRGEGSSAGKPKHPDGQ